MLRTKLHGIFSFLQEQWDAVKWSKGVVMCENLGHLSFETIWYNGQVESVCPRCGRDAPSNVPQRPDEG
jgi:hypothetical protein